MGALKPWHVLALLCIVAVVVLVIGAMAYVRSRRK